MGLNYYYNMWESNTPTILSGGEIVSGEERDKILKKWATLSLQQEENLKKVEQEARDEAKRIELQDYIDSFLKNYPFLKEYNLYVILKMEKGEAIKYLESLELPDDWEIKESSNGSQLNVNNLKELLESFKKVLKFQLTKHFI